MKNQKPNSSKTLTLLLLTIMTVWLSSCKKDKQAVQQVAPVRPVTAQSNAYVTQFFEYNPAPGQFINTGLGDTVAAIGTLKGNQGLVSLGAWGGYIVVGFDHTVLDVAGKGDIVVYGNGFPGFAEPGIIWVMQDTNGNGKPDDTWYELAGSETGQPGYIRNYSVTYTRPACDTCSVLWKDSQGKTGVVQTNVYHTQAYFPIGLKTNTYTLTGTILPSTNIDMSNPSYITSAAWAFGYSDSSAGGDTVDIVNAIDKNGNRVKLKGIDFMKVQTGEQANMGWLGELSTEFCGAADLSILKQ
jgi:hypothetical protein